MSDINKLVENYFAPKSKALGKEKLWEIFDEVYEGLSLIKEEGTQEKEITLPLPRFNLSEKWGEPGHEDRKEVEKFFKKIAPGQNLKDKIDNIMDFVKGCDIQCTENSKISEILPKLIFLESLTSVLRDYNPKTSGFLFESFLAALLAGEQIPAIGNITVEDIMANIDQCDPKVEKNCEEREPAALSLKLMQSGRDVSQSYNNLINSFDKFGKVTFIIAAKEKGNIFDLKFYRIDLDKELMNHMIETGGIKKKKSGKKEGTFTVTIPSTTYLQEQYKISELKLPSPQKLKKIGQQYADGIGKHMFEMYALLKTIGTNLNDYFLEDSKNAAANAQAAAKSLETSIAEETI
tara:strand:+ start:4263 stop:5309 length:1047 start_codon:yes stop_codon:yes gene_type:complete